MAPSPNLEQYAEWVRRSNLVEDDVFKKVLSAVKAEATGDDATGEFLGRRLIDQELITEWQHNKLLHGKYQGFMLGKYKLLRHLSSGGMSSVYLAEHTRMARKVAIKVLPPAKIGDSSFLPRFQRECRVMASLDHPNIVRAHDYDVDGKLHYLVLEYIDGVDLQSLVDKEGPLPFIKAADYIAQAADGLAHAHERSMVHRDMKPANLMLDKRGSIKVLDLGVARITDGDEGPSLTLAHKEDVLGTADFLSPEQALNSHHVDHRADVYSLGCTLYYTLTGRVPFKEKNVAKKLMLHQTAEPPRVTESRKDCPEGLLAICEKMMEKDKDERFQTMTEVSQALRAWAEAWKNGIQYNPLAESQPEPAGAPEKKPGQDGSIFEDDFETSEPITESGKPTEAKTSPQEPTQAAPSAPAPAAEATPELTPAPQPRTPPPASQQPAAQNRVAGYAQQTAPQPDFGQGDEIQDEDPGQPLVPVGARSARGQAEVGQPQPAEPRQPPRRAGRPAQAGRKAAAKAAPKPAATTQSTQAAPNTIVVVLITVLVVVPVVLGTLWLAGIFDPPPPPRVTPVQPSQSAPATDSQATNSQDETPKNEEPAASSPE